MNENEMKKKKFIKNKKQQREKQNFLNHPKRIKKKQKN